MTTLPVSGVKPPGAENDVRGIQPFSVGLAVGVGLASDAVAVGGELPSARWSASAFASGCWSPLSTPTGTPTTINEITIAEANALEEDHC